MTHYLSLAVVITLYICNWTNAVTHNQHCSDGCLNCTADRVCEECKNGYYLRNGWCSECLPNCETCQSWRVCKKCKPGKYMGDEGQGARTDCAFQCRETCPTCNSYNNCTSCIKGKFGRKCSKSCSTNCESNVCYINGMCEPCKIGYYGRKCKRRCPHNCITCTSHLHCTSCSDGYQGKTCEEADKDDCIHYSGAGMCDRCKDGFFGPSCNKTCPEYCKSKICEKDTGSCIGDCQPRRFGDTCDKTCPDGCFSKCNRTTGYCQFCKQGRFGKQCDGTCSANCESNTCNVFDGQCVTCSNGYYGKTCSETCSEGCTERKCDKETANCECSEGFSGEQCNPCVNGYHGKTCQRCPSHCISCFSDTNCIACDNGFWGDHCQSKCLGGHCQGDTCDKYNGTCSKCKKRYHGPYCTKPCSINCLNNRCTQQGKCLKCTAGLYGPICNKTCPDNCLNKTCELDTGLCTKCIDGYYGTLCSNQCPDNCSSCISGKLCTACNVGFYGDICNFKCRNCTAECRISDGNCGNCFPGLTGRQCNKNCSSNCKSCSRYHSSYCESCSNGKYGRKCNVDCSNKCFNRTCDVSDGKCTNKCIDRYKGNHCNCPKNCDCRNYNSGRCFSCVNNTFENTAESCECSKVWCLNESCSVCLNSKYYAVNGRYCCLCSINCKEGECNSEKVCTKGCERGFYGQTCSLKCADIDPFCTICSENKYDRATLSCQTCLHGYYPNDNGLCVKCESGCKDGKCNSSSGHCYLDCVDRYWNQKCDLKCSTNCSACDRNTGECDSCRANTNYGTFCNIPCSDHCALHTCDREHGNCIVGCVHNRYGEKCEEICESTCETIANLTRCDLNGACIHGCQNGYFGTMCKLMCDANCINQTCERESGACEQGCISAFNAVGAICEQAMSVDVEAVGGYIAGGAMMVIGVIVVVFIVVFLVVRKRTRQEQSSNHVQDNSEDASVNGASELGSHELNYMVHDDNIYYNNPDEIGKYRISVDELAKFVAEKSLDYFHTEFLKFPVGLMKPYLASQTAENTAKNRYKGIYPYDESRVKVKGGDTDYINASYVDGYKKRNAYIASFGPTVKQTQNFGVFWRLLWQQNVEKIVMLTNLVEYGMPKCDQYWPSVGTDRIYSDISVTCHSENEYADFTVRLFTMTKDSCKRPLTHFHFTAWPDKGIPEDIVGLVEFRHKVISSSATLDGPTVVHCSAGIGRTGTYIALDILTNEGESEKSVDIPGCVYNMRQNRLNMVQTVEQYQFLHNAVAYNLTSDSKLIKVENVQEYMANTSEEDIDRQFKELEMMMDSRSKSVSQNKLTDDQSRPGAAFAGDANRLRLFLGLNPGTSDYIDAVYINSYTTKRRYIVTQSPTPETVLNFLRLAFQEKCSCIISFDKTSNRDKNIGIYIPVDNEVFKKDVFSVKSTTSSATKYSVTRNISVTYDGPTTYGPKEKTMYHVGFTDWNSASNVPRSVPLFLQFINDVELSLYDNMDEGPVLMHCGDGAGKSGLFCVVSTLLQKMEMEHEVSVMNTVRQVKFRRALAIPNKAQFQFCHRCVQEYCGSYAMYSNFGMKRNGI